MQKASLAMLLACFSWRQQAAESSDYSTAVAANTMMPFAATSADAIRVWTFWSEGIRRIHLRAGESKTVWFITTNSLRDDDTWYIGGGQPPR